MAKKKAASSTQQQRRAAKTTRQHEDLASNDDASAQPMKSYIVLRSSLPAGSFIPAVLLQVLAVAYCILLLHGRPSSLLHISALLRPLMYETKTAMLKTIAGLLLVQLYFAIQLKLWSDRSQKKPEVQSPITEVQQQEPAQEELLPTSPEAEVLPLHRMLLKVDLSRLDLPVSIDNRVPEVQHTKMVRGRLSVCPRNTRRTSDDVNCHLPACHPDGCSGS